MATISAVSSLTATPAGTSPAVITYGFTITDTDGGVYELTTVAGEVLDDTALDNVGDVVLGSVTVNRNLFFLLNVVVCVFFLKNILSL